MATFLQNGVPGRSMTDTLQDLLPAKVRGVDILVGYFYFSGLREIYAHLDDLPVRILVGLDVDQELLTYTAQQRSIVAVQTQWFADLQCRFEERFLWTNKCPCPNAHSSTLSECVIRRM